MSPAYEVAQHLQTTALALPAVFTSREPAEPSECLTVFDTTGIGTDTDEQKVEYPRFQVRLRTRDYAAGMALQQAIRRELIDGVPAGLSAVGFFGINDVSGPFSIGRDDNDRHLIVTNFEAFVDADAPAAAITWGSIVLDPSPAP